jgi:inhibitor of KinA
MQFWLAQHPFDGMKDVVAGYSSVAVFFDPVHIMRIHSGFKSVFEFVRERLEEAWREAPGVNLNEKERAIRIPVCYDPEFGIDLEFISIKNQLSAREIIELHQSRSYYVYMVGFLPGFTYMAEVDQKLVIGRKEVPMPVAEGSVGIAGSQTGIYPLNCPGGWQIIGRTPLKLIDRKAAIPSVLLPGDRVQFFEISREAFDSMASAGEERILDRE